MFFRLSGCCIHSGTSSHPTNHPWLNWGTLRCKLGAALLPPRLSGRLALGMVLWVAMALALRMMAVGRPQGCCGPFASSFRIGLGGPVLGGYKVEGNPVSSKASAVSGSSDRCVATAFQKWRARLGHNASGLMKNKGLWSPKIFIGY
jgi:hypothetical protein